MFAYEVEVYERWMEKETEKEKFINSRSYVKSAILQHFALVALSHANHPCLFGQYSLDACVALCICFGGLQAALSTGF